MVTWNSTPYLHPPSLTLPDMTARQQKRIRKKRTSTLLPFPSVWQTRAILRWNNKKEWKITRMYCSWDVEHMTNVTIRVSRNTYITNRIRVIRLTIVIIHRTPLLTLRDANSSEENLSRHLYSFESTSRVPVPILCCCFCAEKAENYDRSMRFRQGQAIAFSMSNVRTINDEQHD